VYKVMILGCSTVSTGELTMALDWARRLTRPHQLHACVGVSQVNQVKWAGGQPWTYPALGLQRALPRIQEALRSVKPDVIVLADILLAYGLSPEFADGISYAVPEAMKHARVLALDLYDFDSTAMDTDIFGRPLFQQAPFVPRGVGRLHPCPSLIPQKSTPGRGRYAMLEDHGAFTTAEREAARARLGLGSGKVAVITTSAWQHTLVKRPEGAAVTTHFPPLMFRLLNEAARAAGGLTVVHVGPQAFTIPDGCDHLNYQHRDQMPPEDFRALLGSADVYVSPNCPASTAVRASSLRVPVATLHLGNAYTSSNTAAGQALKAYRDAVGNGYAFSLWPVGMHRLVHRVLENNPFAGTQMQLDAARADEAVEGITALLTRPDVADAQRASQEAFFKLLFQQVDTPEDALTAALEGA
jgi:hypothetical protein